MKQGIRKNTLSIRAIWHSDLNGLRSKLTFPELENWKQRKPKKDEYNIGGGKTSGAEILIKMNMIYSLTGQSGPKGARTENGAFISLSHLNICEQPSSLGEKKINKKIIAVRRTFHQERAELERKRAETTPPSDCMCPHQQ